MRLVARSRLLLGMNGKLDRRSLSYDQTQLSHKTLRLRTRRAPRMSTERHFSETPQILAIHHIVHEYANFVASAEMAIRGRDCDGRGFEPSINTHVSHAFYLNCRKLADFFQNRTERNADDVVAMHFAVGYFAKLPVNDRWRKAINKQLAHVTYSRDISPEEITAEAQLALYDELKSEWRRFRAALPDVYASEFARKVVERKSRSPQGERSEFENCDLD